MIRYLNEGEKGACRGLWQEAFPQDSEAFVEYYFSRKTKDNQVLVKEDETGRILTMAHLNPYQVMVKGRSWKLNYIVGVATAADSRRQGHMRDIIVKMLLDMYEEGMPFCYLMPASEAIYLPFGFRFIFDQPLWQMKMKLPEGVRREGIVLSHGKESSDVAGNLALWMNRWLGERYQVYAWRDERYMEELKGELESENGRIFGWYDRQGGLKALQAEWGLEKREQRFLYSMEPDWVEEGAAEHGRENEAFTPAIMARITNVNQMMEAICLDDEAPCGEAEVLIRIRDEWIPGNQGLWRWRLNAGGSRLTPEPAGPAGAPLFSTEALDIDVASLGTWLFGYDTLANLGMEAPWWCRFVKPLQGIFLDEIV